MTLEVLCKQYHGSKAKDKQNLKSWRGDNPYGIAGCIGAHDGVPTPVGYNEVSSLVNAPVSKLVEVS